MKISVLIPSYNHARFLPACLDALFAQTHADWEALLIDDGSADDSLAIAQTYAARDPRLRVLKNETNLGTYGTQQRALESTSGDAVAILNSDDVWMPEKLAVQVDQLRRYPDAAYAYALGLLVDADGQPYRTQNQHADWPVDERQQPLPFLLSENRILASSVLFRRAGLSFDPSLRYSGDWAALLSASLRGPAAFVPEPMVAWRQHGDNTYVRTKPQVLEEIRVRRAIEAHRSTWLASGSPLAEVEQGLARNLVHLQALLLLAGNRRQARLAIQKAAKHADRRLLTLRRIAPYLPTSLLRRRFGDGAAIDLRPGNVETSAPIRFE